MIRAIKTYCKGAPFYNAFLNAWKAEFGESVDGIRAFVRQLEEIGLNPPKAVLSLRRSALAQLLREATGISEEDASVVLGMLTLVPRPQWRLAHGEFKNKDWFPWRFRRRLSAYRRPLIKLDDGDDPTVSFAPGFVAEAFYAMARWFHSGELPSSQARSREMSRWIGHANNVQRLKFNSTVADRMRELGWHAESEIKLTKILNRSLDRNYGDIDVLAWRPESGRVLVIECKDVQYNKTLGEIAEQLVDYRGAMRPDGKPDHLKRHLDRLDVLTAHKAALSKALRLTSTLAMTGHLVFKNPVPMRFAWEHMADTIRLSLFDELDRL